MTRPPHVVAIDGPAATGKGTVMRATVTGEVSQLGMQRIKVGSLACAVPARLTWSVDRFVIGDPVRLACLEGKVVSVRYSPELAPNQTSRPGTGNAPTTVAPVQPGCGPACTKEVSYSMGTIFLGGGPTGVSSTATGAISDISDGSITAGGLTCTYRPAFDALFQIAQVGDNVTLTCTGGVFVGMQSVGSVSR